MLDVLITLRLLVVESFNQLPDGEDIDTARTWADLLEAEASALVDGAADWAHLAADLLHCDSDAVATYERRARALGRADGRLSLILADQFVAALIRGHLSESMP